MTLCAAWIRTVGKTKELVVASDSRLAGGIRWDGCPKIITFSRSDFVICFAGNTVDAYPFMLQVNNAIENYSRASSGALDVTELSGHVARVFSGMRQHVSLESGKQDVKFILAGYSWKRKAFRIYTMTLCGSDFMVRREHKYVFIGDEVPSARRRLKKLLLERGKLIYPNNFGIGPDAQLRTKIRFLRTLRKRIIMMLRASGEDSQNAKTKAQKILRTIHQKKATAFSLNYEPFEVLRDIIKEEISPYIGGPPQLLKIYEHMNCIPYGIFWPNLSSNLITLFGRQLLDYEKTRYIVMDPDTLVTYETKGKLVPKRQPRQ